MGKLKIMGKQKPPGDIPPGVFCFLTVRYTLNNRIFISRWFITVIPENVLIYIIFIFNLAQFLMSVLGLKIPKA